MTISTKDIQKLIDNGQNKQALRQLKQMIQEKPTADAWYLTALAVDSDEQKIKALKKALQLDALHTPANRLLHKLEGTPVIQPEEPTTTPDWQLDAALNREKKVERLQQTKKAQSSGCRRRFGCGCLMSLMFSAILSTIVFSAIGLVPGAIGAVIRLTSGVAPVYEIDGLPIEQVGDSLYRIEPEFSKPLSPCAPKSLTDIMDCNIEFIDHGYVQEYYFATTQDYSYVLFLNFLSLNATNLVKNVSILDSNGNNATPNCQLLQISEYSNGLVYQCVAYIGGTWSIRLLGINGESIGGYIIGVQKLDF